MIQTQQQLDHALNRQHVIPVIISANGPLPQGNRAYDGARLLPQSGFSFTPRELLHAIGCKTAALPVSRTDECLKAAWLYTYILDLEGANLRFTGGYGSDLQTSRSQEVGIGMLCLIAERYFGIPWDQLGPLVGQGKRFDYRGSTSNLRCIFESKGTSYRTNQIHQIEDGLDKKQSHHDRGEYFDVELIISSCIPQDGSPPRILMADPDKSSLKESYDRGDDRYFRLKHYSRVLQFIGLPRSAYELNQLAKEHLEQKRSIYHTILSEKSELGHLQRVHVNGDDFLGRWFHDWVPEKSKRYRHLYEKSLEFPLMESTRRRSVFQGVRRDVYESGFQSEPFAMPLIDAQTLEKYKSTDEFGVSVFPDGTLMAFKQD